MTIDEAISLLKQYIDYNNPDIPDFYTMEEACKVVIKVLEQEPYGDCISRQAVEDAIYDYSRSCDVNYAQIMEFIDKLPSVTAQPKMGYWEWLQYDGNPKIGNWHCSECRTIVPRIPEVDNTPIYKWCPMCGAKMSKIQTGAEGSDKE